ncbi:hypothetical protein DESC_290087 [Desulfosarcina cetonica]|nr:hypothetical protein DESC_290087 [Desulfosarcina cetonica]
MFDLVVKSAKDVFRRARVVILDKIDCETGLFLENGLVEALEEKSPLVAENRWLQDENISNFSLYDIH